MTDTLKRLCNLLLRDGMKEDAFEALYRVIAECEAINDMLYNEGIEPREPYPQGHALDMIRRTKNVRYPHGVRIEFRDGEQYEGLTTS